MTFLLSMLLSCSDAAWIIQGIRQSELMDRGMKSELILEVYRGTDPQCDMEQALSEAKPRGQLLDD